jgi:hypothetical protein
MPGESRKIQSARIMMSWFNQCSRSAPQSEILNGGFASMKSALRSRSSSLWKLPSCSSEYRRRCARVSMKIVLCSANRRKSPDGPRSRVASRPQEQPEFWLWRRLARLLGRLASEDGDRGGSHGAVPAAHQSEPRRRPPTVSLHRCASRAGASVDQYRGRGVTLAWHRSEGRT